MKRNSGLYNKYYNAYNFGVGKRSFSPYVKDEDIRSTQSASSSRDSLPSSQYNSYLPSSQYTPHLPSSQYRPHLPSSQYFPHLSSSLGEDRRIMG